MITPLRYSFSPLILAALFTQVISAETAEKNALPAAPKPLVSEKIQLAKPESEPDQAEKTPTEDEKSETKIQNEPAAAKSVEVPAVTKKEPQSLKSTLTVGGSISIVNSSGEIHKYLDTGLGFGVFAYTPAVLESFPVSLFFQAGYMNASSYRVQSMSFFHGQAGVAWQIALFDDFSFTPYFAAGLHAGKYSPVSNGVAASFLVPSFDAGVLCTYSLTREVALALKGGFMPVLDKYVSTNFLHIGAGVTYAL